MDLIGCASNIYPAVFGGRIDVSLIFEVEGVIIQLFCCILN